MKRMRGELFVPVHADAVAIEVNEDFRYAACSLGGGG
jgi:hypothetical protein